MSYVRQGTLFTYEDFVAEKDDNARLVLTLSALPDERLLSWLREHRDGHRDDYPLEMLWRCLIAKFVYQIKTYAELIRELHRNGSLRRLVGIASAAWVPEDYHLSRFLKLLSSEAGLAHLDAMFRELVAKLAGKLDGFGKHLAIDGTAVHAYSNEERKHKSDRDAAWSARPKRQRRKKPPEIVNERLDYWFGYVVHLVVDCESELPVGYELTAANVSETTRFVPLLETLDVEHPTVTARTETLIADAGYAAARTAATY